MCIVNVREYEVQGSFPLHFFWVGPPTHPSNPHLSPPTHVNSKHTKKTLNIFFFQKTQTINSEKPKSLHTTKTLTLAKVGLAKVGLAKVGLAKVGFDRSVVGDAVKVQTQREEEMAEGKRRLEFRPKQPPNWFCRTDELTHTRRHVAQLEGDPRQSHQKISAETSLKQCGYRASLAVCKATHDGGPEAAGASHDNQRTPNVHI